MPNSKQDRAGVAGDQDHELEYDAIKTGATVSGRAAIERRQGK